MTELTIQILEGLERGKVFSHLEPPFTIGREISNEIALNDESVSRYHAKIQADNERIILTDLGSTNGTRINGHPVQLKVLKPGDQIHIGRCVLLFGSFDEIEETLGYSDGQTGIDSAGQETQKDLEVNQGMVAPGSRTVNPEVSLDLFPQGCPEVPEDLKLVQRAQISDLLAFMHNRLVQLMAESHEESNADENREVRIPWETWQRMIRTEMELAQALQKIADPE